MNLKPSKAMLESCTQIFHEYAVLVSVATKLEVLKEVKEVYENTLENPHSAGDEDCDCFSCILSRSISIVESQIKDFQVEGETG